MRKNETLKIRIIGHTNGNDMSLSQKRAITIKKFLEKRSIDQNRISTEGRGGTEMLYELGPNTPEWQQILNRRVEIFITEK